ncbi:MAG: hypothetical protein AAF958_18970, partial [Planctomycetota bacterium]
ACIGLPLRGGRQPPHDVAAGNSRVPNETVAGSNPTPSTSSNGGGPNPAQGNALVFIQNVFGDPCNEITDALRIIEYRIRETEGL